MTSENKPPLTNFKADSFGFGAEAKKTLFFPNQKVVLSENGQAFVSLEDDDELEIPYEIARFILFALKLRDKEVRINYQNLKSETLKRLIMLSNCHRTMLVALGFNFKDVLNNDFGSAIIDKFFKKNTKLKIEEKKLDELESSVLRKRKKTFPLSLNFFRQSIFQSGQLEAFHSALVLGVSKNGKIICFHKDGIGDNNQVELTDLEQVIQASSDRGESNATLVSQKNVSNIFDDIRKFAKLAK